MHVSCNWSKACLVELEELTWLEWILTQLQACIDAKSRSSEPLSPLSSRLFAIVMGIVELNPDPANCDLMIVAAQDPCTTVWWSKGRAYSWIVMRWLNVSWRKRRWGRENIRSRDRDSWCGRKSLHAWLQLVFTCRASTKSQHTIAIAKLRRALVKQQYRNN